MKIERVGDIICTLGEGPVWNQETESIYWVDILQGNIHQYCNTTKEYKSLNTGQIVGSICLHTSHQLIAALENGFATIDLENEIITHIADPENDLTENRFNDGKCDPAGRFWAGTMNKSGGHPTGNLYMLDPNMGWWVFLAATVVYFFRKNLKLDAAAPCLPVICRRFLAKHGIYWKRKKWLKPLLISLPFQDWRLMKKMWPTVACGKRSW